MKLNLKSEEVASIVNGHNVQQKSDAMIQQVAYDTRKISYAEQTLFIALKGEFRDGHDYIQKAYDIGVRNFLIETSMPMNLFPEANFIQVEQTLAALQKLAQHHRQQFTYPVIAITGSAGKTIVKEWLAHLLAGEKRVYRSPKSYNSQLGVAISLLEMHSAVDLAIIELGISEPGEMKRLVEMVQPTYGILTSIGSAHLENFSSIEALTHEKLSAFDHVTKTFVSDQIQLTDNQLKKCHGERVNTNIQLSSSPLQDKISLHNLALAIHVAQFIGVKDEVIENRIQSISQLSMRMEVFEGTNNNLIINDTYNLDLDGLKSSLEHQLVLAGTKKRIVIIGLDEQAFTKKEEISELIARFQPEKTIYICENESLEEQFSDSVILIKGTRKANIQKIASQFRLKKHKTVVEIDLHAIRANISVFKNYLKPTTKMLAMVKASSYGSGGEKIAQFLEQQGINYLGVAYADEGVELRKAGITTPILVMNAEEEGFEDCIHYQLEPAIYSFHQLDEFIKELIIAEKANYPIHLKVDTGMHRLGFLPDEIDQVLSVIQAQPEVKIESVYSHLADADNEQESTFTLNQINTFNNVVQKIENQITYPFIKHILNSEGIVAYSNAQYDMVRIGIGLYGYISNSTILPQLIPAVKWKSVISQLKTIAVGESVGYGCSYTAQQATKIAIIPVGYADGFRRSLGNEKGKVAIHGMICPVIGRVCMDMIMVDVSNISGIKEGDEVEIIGSTITMQDFAQLVETIPYEVMTNIAKRVHRIYLE